MSEKYQFEEECPDNIWYTKIPNCLRFAKLNPFQRTLYSEIKSIAGDNGECFKSAKHLAETCMMSERKVAETLKELCEINPILGVSLLKKTCRYRPDGGQASSLYTIVNIWPINRKMYLSIISEGYAPHAGGGMHQVQGAYAPGADEEEHIKKNPKEEEPNHSLNKVSSKDNVLRADAKAKTVPSKNPKKTVDAAKRFKLDEDQEGVYSWLTEHCPDVCEGTRCYWSKNYSFQRISDVYHEAKSRNPKKSLGGYMNKLFKENATVPNARSQECAEYAAEFKLSVGWSDLHIGKKYATFHLGDSQEDIDLHQDPVEFARQLHQKYSISKKYT